MVGVRCASPSFEAEWRDGAPTTGQRVGRAARFHEVRLEERVPADRPWRRVDALSGPGFVREHAAGHSRAVGRPSILPELTARTLLAGGLSARKASKAPKDDVIGRAGASRARLNLECATRKC